MAHRLLSSEYLYITFFTYIDWTDTLTTDNAVNQFQFTPQTNHVLLL